MASHPSLSRSTSQSLRPNESSSTPSSLAPSSSSYTPPALPPHPHPPAREARDPSTSRSRSPSSRPLSSVQSLLRSNPSSSHLCLASSSPSCHPNQDHQTPTTLGNSLRRPPDVVPIGTEGLSMPEFDSAEAKNDLSSVGLSFGGSPSGGLVDRMRRASSSNSLTFPTMARAGRMGSAGGEGAAPPEDPNHSSHVPTSVSSTGPLSPLPFPAPRVHIRSQGARPSTPTQPLASPLSHHAGPAVLHPSALASPNFSKSHPATHSSSTHDGTPSPQILPSLPTLPTLPPHPSFSPSGRRPSRSRSRRGSLLAFSDGDEREFRYPPTGSPPESLVFEAPDSTEDVLSRASALLSLEGHGNTEEHGAQEALEKRSEDERVASASSSLPERPKASAASIAKDEWSWGTFMEAYAEGRWDPFQIPTPPVGSIPAHPLNAPGLRDQGSHRSGSASAPTSSASITAPRPGTPPATSTQSAARLAESAAAKEMRSSSYTSPRPPKLQLPSFSKVPVMMQKPPLPSPMLESAPHLQAPSASSHQPHQQSTGEQGQGPGVRGGGGTAGAEGKRKKPFMQNEEFAATVRLAGATSNLAPFVLPSPDQEHTDPLRNYSSLSSSSSLIQHQATRSQDGGGKRSVPRKSKSGRFGTSWTASAGGLIPSMAADDSHAIASGTSRLAVIPGTPSTESHDPFSTSPEVSPTNLHLPMATAPLPVTEGKQAVRRESDGADYFGEPKLWAGGKAAGGPAAGGGEDPLAQLEGDSRRGSASGWGALLARREDSRNGGSAGSDSSTRTILGRGRSYAGPLPGSSSSSYGPSLSSSFSSSTHVGDGDPADMMGGLVLDVSSPGGQIQGRHASEAFEQFLSLPYQADSQSNSNTSSRRSSVVFPPSADSPTPSSDHTTPTHSVPILPPNLTKLSSSSLPGLRPVNGRSAASYAGSGSHASAPSASTSRPVAGSKDSRDFDRLGWLPAPEPPDEKERRKALYRYDVLQGGQDANFDRIAHLAKLVFNTKIVLISLVDDHRQWFKSESGFGGGGCRESDRFPSFCSHTILQKTTEPLVVLDTSRDWRFVKNPLVLGDPHVRFYAGTPLQTPEGYNIGSLCLIDDKPRTEFSPRQRHVLKEFGQIVMREMELWRDKLHLRRRGMIQDSMEKFTRETIEMDGSVDVALNKVQDEAARLIRTTLDADGALVIDLSAFELVETVDAFGNTESYYQVDSFSSSTADPSDGEHTPGREAPPTFLERANSSSPLPALPVLSASELFEPPESRTKPVPALEHHKLAHWLKEYPDGQIYERVPSFLKTLLPKPQADSKVQWCMCVPVYNIDRNPFALIVCYTNHIAKEFIEGYELKYLRAVGLIILSAVLKRRLSLADSAKGVFISNISHELRTPLHGILIGSELLSETEMTSNQNSYLETIQACGQSLIETVNHVLDFTKLSGSSKGKVSANKSMEKTEVDLLKLIEETVEGCWIGQKARAVLDSGGIGSMYAPPPVSATGSIQHVECVVDAGLRQKGWRVKCEKAGIRRVLMNLIGNALKFTSDGYVQVTLRELIPSDPDSNYVPLEIAVIDTGKGISRDFLKNQLFQPFSQENPLHTGTGLGLAIVNSIVSSEAVNGRCDVWSSEDIGTEIKVSLNVEQGREKSLGDPLSMSAFGSGFSVSLLGFSEEHRGLKLAREVLEGYLEDWSFVIHDESDPGWGDVLFINDDSSRIDAFSVLGNVARPIILYASTRGDPQQAKSINAYVAAGGFATILFKPAGPLKLEAATKACLRSLEGMPSRRASGASLRRLSSRSHSPARGGHHRAPSEPADTPPFYNPPSIASPSGSRTYSSRSSASSHSEIALAGNNGIPGSGCSASAAHQLSPSHYLQRRRSEEEREPRRKARRPSLAPRSITFQPDTTSPLAVAEDYPKSLSHHHPVLPPSMLRKLSTDTDLSSSGGTPSSPGSIISLSDGGSALKASAVIVKEEDVNASLVKTADEPVPRVLVVEDNPINRKVLAAFLNRKKFPFDEACNGQEGLEAFERQPSGYYDVILMDLSMPVLDGIGATKAIRAVEAARRKHTRSISLPVNGSPSKTTATASNGGSQDGRETSEDGSTMLSGPEGGSGGKPGQPGRVRILALTGLATEGDKKMAFASGVDGYLVKPVSLKTLSSVFKKVGF